MSSVALRVPQHKGYGSIRNDDEEAGAEGNCSSPKLITICRRVCIVLAAVGVLANLSIFIWAYHHDSNYPYDVPESPVTNNVNCSIRVRDSDIFRFKELVNDKKYDSLFVRLETSQNVSKSNFSHIYEPQNWIWARENSPILDLPSSYPIWSFGILDIRTKRNVTFHLELSPPGCEFQWGDEKTEIAVGKALVNFTLSERNRYNWCYSVRLRDVKKFPALEKDFSFFVQDLGYKCCHNHHIEGTDQIVTLCPDDVIVQRIWTHMPFTIAFLTLLIFPNIMVYIYQFLSFKSHVYWIHHRHESHDHDDSSLDYASTKSEWIHTDYKSPVSFMSFLRSLPNMRLLRYFQGVLTSVGLVSLSLLFVLLPVLMYQRDQHSLQMLDELIHNDVPIGFLSIMFPYEDNHGNFMSHMNGPFVFFPVYTFLAIVYLIILGSSEPGENKKKTQSDTGKFSLNLDLVEKYGRIHISKHYRHGTFETFHANARAVLRGSFWVELWNRLCCIEGNYCIGLLIPFAVLFSFFVHCIPFLFASLLILSNLIHRINKGTYSCFKNACVVVITVVSLSIFHLVLVYFYTIIYFGSAEFVCFVISFCVLAIIIFPTVAAGMFVYILIAFFYVMKRFREVARKYASHRDAVISVSQSLNDKCKFAEARVEQRYNGQCLLLSGVNILLVKYIVIDKFPKQMEMKNVNGFHCHLKGNLLKVIAQTIPEGLQEVKVCGVSVRIDLKDGEISSKEDRITLEIGTTEKNLKIKVVSNESLRDDAAVTDEHDSCFVTYRNGLPGIPRELLDRAVHEYMPVGAERVQAFIWFLVVLGIVIWVSSIIIHFNQMEQINAIIQSMVLVVLVRLSDVMKMFSIDVDEGQKMKIKHGDLRLTVLEFWTEKRFKPDKNDQVAETAQDDRLNIQEETSSTATSNC